MHASRKSFIRRKIQAASERGRRMAAARWKLDRQRRDALAAQDPAFTGLKIVRRIIVIDNEQAVRESVIYSTDSIRSAKRKLKAVLLCQVK